MGLATWHCLNCGRHLTVVEHCRTLYDRKRWVTSQVVDLKYTHMGFDCPDCGPVGAELVPVTAAGQGARA